MCLPKEASWRCNQDKTEYRILGLTMFASGKGWNKGNGGRGWSGAGVGKKDDVVTPRYEYITSVMTPMRLYVFYVLSLHMCYTTYLYYYYILIQLRPPTDFDRHDHLT